MKIIILKIIIIELLPENIKNNLIRKRSVKLLFYTSLPFLNSALFLENFIYNYFVINQLNNNNNLDNNNNNNLNNNENEYYKIFKLISNKYISSITRLSFALIVINYFKNIYYYYYILIIFLLLFYFCII